MTTFRELFLDEQKLLSAAELGALVRRSRTFSDAVRGERVRPDDRWASFVEPMLSIVQQGALDDQTQSEVAHSPIDDK